MEATLFNLKVTYDSEVGLIILEGNDALDKNRSSRIRLVEVAQLHFLLNTIQDLIKNNIKSKIVKVPNAKICIKKYLDLEEKTELLTEEVNPISPRRIRSPSPESFIFRTRREKSLDSPERTVSKFIFKEENPEVSSTRREESFDLPSRFRTPPRITPRREEESFGLLFRSNSPTPIRSRVPPPPPPLPSRSKTPPAKGSSPVRASSLVRSKSPSPVRISSLRRPTSLVGEEEKCTIIPYKSKLENLPILLEGKTDTILGNPKDGIIFRVLSNSLIIEGNSNVYNFDRLLRVWRVENRVKILLFEGNMNIGNPFGLPDGRIIGAVHSENKSKLVILSHKTWKFEITSEEISGHGYASTFRLLDNCQIMAIVSGNVKIWDLNTLELKLSLSNYGEARDSDILPNGYIIVACHRKVEIWDPISNKLMQILQHSHVMSYSDRMGHVSHLKAISDDRFITATSPGVQIWNRRTHEKLTLMSSSGFGGFLLLGNGWLAACSSGYPKTKIKIWDIETGGIVKSLEMNIDIFKSKIVLLSSDQIGISSNNKIVLWNFKTNTSKVIYEGEYVIDFGIFQNNKIYVILGKEIYQPGRSMPDIRSIGVEIIS
jgi:WD40 repeat protein